MRPSSERGSAGFTLIEMLVVVAVLGLAMGIAASFVPRRNARLELANAAELVANGLRTARAASIAGARPVSVFVEPGGQSLRIDGARRTLPPGVKLDVPAGVRFAPDGSATPAQFRLSAPGTAITPARITVDWLTGRVVTSDAA